MKTMLIECKNTLALNSLCRSRICFTDYILIETMLLLFDSLPLNYIVSEEELSLNYFQAASLAFSGFK